MELLSGNFHIEIDEKLKIIEDRSADLKYRCFYILPTEFTNFVLIPKITKLGILIFDYSRHQLIFLPFR